MEWIKRKGEERRHERVEVCRTLVRRQRSSELEEFEKAVRQGKELWVVG